MGFEQIMAIVVASAPSLAAIIGSILTVVKNRSISKELTTSFDELKAEVISTKEYTELKEQLIVAHKENMLLKTKINELLTAVDKVIRKD